MPQIGSLFVRLGLESAEFREGLKRATQAASSSAANIAQALAAAGAAAAAMAAVIGREIYAASQRLDQLGKAAQAAGSSVEGLAKLQHAAELSGLSFEQLSTALTRLNVGVAGIGSGAGGASAALRALGVAATETSDQALARVADAFARMPDSAQKSALAVEIFGRAGAQLIPLLNQGSAGIASLGAEAERLGLVVDRNATAAAERFNDALSRLIAVKRGITTQIAAGFLPAVSALVDSLARGVRVGEGWLRLGQSMSAVFLRVAEAAAVVGETIRAMAGALLALDRATRRLAAGQLGGAIEELQVEGLRVQELIARRRAAFAAARAAARWAPDSAEPRPAPPPQAEEAAPIIIPPVRIGSARASPVQPRPADEIADWQRRMEGVTVRARALLEGAMEPIARLSNEIAVSWEEIAVRLPAPAIAEMMLRAHELAGDIARNVGQAVVYGRSLGDALVSSLRAAAAELVTSGLIQALQGGGGGRGLLGLLFGLPLRVLGRAAGGPIEPGRPYWVGERGPELVVPRRAGVVVPQAAAAGGLTVQVDARGAADPAAIEDAVVRGVRAAVAISRGDLAALQLRRLPRAAGAWR